MSEQILQGQAAIVTGAGWGEGGIGRTIAMDLARLGARVLVSDVQPTAEKTVEWIAKEVPGASLLAHAGDLSDETVVAAMIEQAVSEWGQLDILVNNAGGGIIQPFLDHTPETLRETVKRNLWTTVWSTYYALPYMVEANYGRIVNIGADSVRNGLWDHAGYNAAKGGVHGMTTGLAREFGAQDITVNTVAPCAVNTERMRSRVAYDDTMADKFTSVIPKGRPAELVEISSMVVHLCKPESAFVTGQVISVNGGSTML